MAPEIETSGPVEFPVGFVRFHPRAFVNYQMNRAHSLGFAEPTELRKASSDIHSAEDCVSVMDALSRRVATEGRLRSAAGYVRIAEFFTPGHSPDKLTRYRRYRELFDAAFADAGIVREESSL